MTIPRKKGANITAFIFMIIFTVFMTAIGILGFYMALSEQEDVMIAWISVGLCILLAVFFLLMSIYFAKNIRRTDPLLEINDRYFIDRSSWISVGEIAWNDIEKIYLKNDYYQTWLLIQLKDPQLYMDRLNGVQRFLARLNKKTGYENICISLKPFSKQAPEFLKVLNQHKTVYLLK